MSATRDVISPVHPVTDTDFRRMVDAVEDYAIFMLDAHGRVASWNRGAELAKGYAASEIIGRHFSTFYPQDRIDEGWPERELALAREHGRVEDEGWRLRKDGSRFWASVVITALFDEDGGLRGYAKVTRDLSERREQEELLRQSDERFRLIVEGVRDYAIFMLDTEGNIVTWNLGAQLNKGYLAEEILGRHFSLFYTQPDIDRGWPEQELALALRDGRFEDEGWRVRKDGSRFWANVVITPLYGPQGRHRGFSKITRDLTQQQQITRLEDEGRQLTRFLAVLGHELRNPLSSIANVASVMELEESQAPRIRRLRDVLARQVGHLKRLVDDLLDVGRIVSGKVRLESTPVLLQDVVGGAVEAVTPEIDRHRHVLHQDIEGEELWVSGDRVRLVQVLTNLLQNAAKFTPDGGEVRVRLRRAGPQAELMVSDTGPGIPKEKLHHVFKLFAQGEEDHAAREHGGLGIGLSLAHQMVEQHGGEISAFSSGEPGKGVEFVVALPLIDPP
ncbi:MAG TPA: PAS domain-containing sensor histidine kinase [Xanthomonadaceae bacterium]|nr:PAS domain-containing sensor histidine kinase [Xanthomonadaceae bacterium]